MISVKPSIPSLATPTESRMWFRMNFMSENSRVYIKEIKTHPSALLSYVRKWEFLRTREKCIEKHEAQPSASRSSRVFLKIPKCTYNSTMHEDEVFYFFYTMLRKSRALKLVT